MTTRRRLRAGLVALAVAALVAGCRAQPIPTLTPVGSGDISSPIVSSPIP